MHRGDACTLQRIEEALCVLISTQEKIMAGLDDLNTAVNALDAQVAATNAYLQGLPALIAGLKSAADTDAAIEALAQRVQADVAALQSATAAAPSEAAPAA